MLEIIIQFFADNLPMIIMLVLASFLGMEIIGKVPTVLHTPLMSGANAISGVVAIGAIILVRSASPDDYFSLGLGSVGIALAIINVAGGFAVTNRMLEMFKKKKDNKSS
ncbi:NAD(P) transhydrogenase subunit alpha [Aureibacter tunicatorum]|uniref:proton-translocating NAD(P)(+) transhydrogenase n=1 Tax=Aureibacter tunicatorum TaxID=866807 RepID=A0AAE3XJH0_9BACT|nr:NAD(P) transhydrogenase subunit alpha [Aureibacter tunicatorum]MDR6237158.1 NAD(P) transhydrogenase subunit alpha [Aureibacter tunicatorum]BDD06150.1 pyridine nucleotide transhydrogenase subunit alpha [Aureibacter tunicatorum]